MRSTLIFLTKRSSELSFTTRSSVASTDLLKRNSTVSSLGSALRQLRNISATSSFTSLLSAPRSSPLSEPMLSLCHPRRSSTTSPTPATTPSPSTPSNPLGLAMFTHQQKNLLEERLPESTLKLHDDTVAAGNGTYIDPETGYTVFCRKAHIEKGKCCGSGCRHCPYGWVNVPAHRKPRALPTPAAPAAPVSGSTATAAVPDVEDLASSTSGKSKKAFVEKEEEAAAVADAVKKSRVYTRTGDKGKSGLCNGERRPKTDLVFEALGTVDELSSCLGVAKEYLRLQQAQRQAPINIVNNTARLMTEEEKKAAEAAASEGALLAEKVNQIISVEAIEHLQQLLMDIGTIVATPVNSERCSERAKERVAMYDPDAWVKDLERHIDYADSFLPPITVFILPGGGLASAHLHLARSMCRRAERCMHTVVAEQGAEYGETMSVACKFINRLSDFLFVAARAVALHADIHRSGPNGTALENKE